MAMCIKATKTLLCYAHFLTEMDSSSSSPTYSYDSDAGADVCAFDSESPYSTETDGDRMSFDQSSRTSPEIIDLCSGSEDSDCESTVTVAGDKDVASGINGKCWVKRKFECVEDPAGGIRSLCEICGEVLVFRCKVCPAVPTPPSPERRPTTSELLHLGACGPSKSLGFVGTLQWTVGDFILVYVDHPLDHSVINTALKTVGNTCCVALLVDVWIPVHRGMRELFYQAFEIQDAQVMGLPDFGGGYKPLYPEQVCECPGFPYGPFYSVNIPVMASIKLIKMLWDSEQQARDSITARWISQGV